MSKPLTLRFEFDQTKRDFFQGRTTREKMHEAADAYIASLRRYKKENKIKRLRIPTRAQLVR